MAREDKDICKMSNGRGKKLKQMNRTRPNGGQRWLKGMGLEERERERERGVEREGVEREGEDRDRETDRLTDRLKQKVLERL